MNLKYELRNGWKVINEMNNMDAVMEYSNQYMDFLDKGKTERRCVKEIERLAIENGFKSISDIEKVVPGDKIYAINRDKNIALFVIGKQDIEKGLRIIGSHIDSPRLETHYMKMTIWDILKLTTTVESKNINGSLYHLLCMEL